MTMLTFVDVTDTARIQRVLIGAQRGAGGGRPAEVGIHPARLLRAPLAAHHHHRLCRDARRTRPRAASIRSSANTWTISHRRPRALLALINDILDLATVDAGIMSLDIRETDIAAVASAVG